MKFIKEIFYLGNFLSRKFFIRKSKNIIYLILLRLCNSLKKYYINFYTINELIQIFWGFKYWFLPSNLYQRSFLRQHFRIYAFPERIRYRNRNRQNYTKKALNDWRNYIHPRIHPLNYSQVWKKTGTEKQKKDYKKNICGYITKKIVRESIAPIYKQKVKELCDKYSCDYGDCLNYYDKKI